MPEAVPVPVPLLVRIEALLTKIEHQTTTSDEPIIVRPLKRAFKMAGVGNTRGHELIKEGVFEVVPIGKRGRGITLRSIKRMGVSAQRTDPAA